MFGAAFSGVFGGISVKLRGNLGNIMGDCEKFDGILDQGRGHLLIHSTSFRDVSEEYARNSTDLNPTICCAEGPMVGSVSSINCSFDI